MKFQIGVNGEAYGGYRHAQNGFIDCCERPDDNHVLGDNWQSDPMNPAVMWKPKTQAELDAETAALKAEIKSLFQGNDAQFKAIRLAFSAVLAQAQTGTLNTYTMAKLLDDVANNW